MTYRTQDTDNHLANTSSSAPVRHLRRRRAMRAVHHRSGGITFSGLGI